MQSSHFQTTAIEPVQHFLLGLFSVSLSHGVKLHKLGLDSYGRLGVSGEKSK